MDTITHRLYEIVNYDRRLLMTTLLTVKQAAQQLHVTPAFLYLQIQAGLISHVRIGTRAIRIEQSALDDYVQRGRFPASERTRKLLAMDRGNAHRACK